MRLGDLDALKEDFNTRLEKAKNWEENAINRKDYEIAIRAKATSDFICEVIMTIDNAPTVAVNCKDCDGYEAGYSAGLKDAERPQGEWIRTGSLGNGNAHYECSNCHYGDEHAESQEVPYCWHCGADMRKEGVE